MKSKSQIANIVTAIRIPLSIAMLFMQALSVWFLILYALCGISDMLDGYLARKTHSAGRFGATLDSIADFVLFAVLVYKLLPVLRPSLFLWIWLGVIALLRLLAVTAVYIRHKTFCMLHTYANKATGFFLLLLPFALPFAPKDFLLILALSLATLSAVEEVLIDLIAPDLQSDRKSIFHIKSEG